MGRAGTVYMLCSCPGLRITAPAVARDTDHHTGNEMPASFSCFETPAGDVKNDGALWPFGVQFKLGTCLVFAL